MDKDTKPKEERGGGGGGGEKSFLEKLRDNWEEWRETKRQMGDYIDMAPGIGEVRNFLNSAFGRDLFSGDKLSDEEKAAAILAAIPIAGKAAKGAKAAKEATEAAKNKLKKPEKIFPEPKGEAFPDRELPRVPKGEKGHGSPKPDPDPPPLQRMIIDTTKNQGYRKIRDGYVEAIGAWMWLGNSFFEVAPKSRDAVISDLEKYHIPFEDTVELITITAADTPFYNEDSYQLQSDLRYAVYGVRPKEREKPSSLKKWVYKLQKRA